MEYVEEAVALLSKQIEDLEDKLARVKAAREALEAISDGVKRPDHIKKAVQQKRVMSEDARSRIAEAQRKRWACVNAAVPGSDDIHPVETAHESNNAAPDAFAVSADFKVTPIPVENIETAHTDAAVSSETAPSVETVEPPKTHSKAKKAGQSHN